MSKAGHLDGSQIMQPMNTAMQPRLMAVKIASSAIMCSIPSLGEGGVEIRRALAAVGRYALDQRYVGAHVFAASVVHNHRGHRLRLPSLGEGGEDAGLVVVLSGGFCSFEAVRVRVFVTGSGPSVDEFRVLTNSSEGIYVVATKNAVGMRVSFVPPFITRRQIAFFPLQRLHRHRLRFPSL